MSARSAAVFLSYASADIEAARRIAAALRGAGIETWLDESELRGGDAWDASIRAQIRDCALFVPIVSMSTDARSEGYFRLEWRLAVERSRLIADDRPFLLPVVVDETTEAAARVPDAFLERQWTRVIDSSALDAFAAHVRALLASPPAARKNGAPSARRSSKVVYACVAVLVAVAIAAALVWIRRPASQDTAHPLVAEHVPSAKSIAVLPFENLSARSEDAYLADGLQEEILSALARVRDLTVVSRASTREYRGKAQNAREIGARLGVGTLLQGSIRREDASLRLTVQLVDARSDSAIFSANYDRDMAHVLDLQSKVGRQVADALSATLTQYERGELERVATNSGDAYDRYLRAVAIFRQETPDDEMGLAEPMRLLDESLKLDPDFAEAWALLSQAHGWQYFANAQPEDGEAAKAAFERAAAIDPELPEATLARGIYELYVVRDLDRAIGDFAAYAKRRPNSGTAEAMLGFALRRKARFDEALPHFDRAWVLDPLNAAISGGTLTTLLGMRRYPEAIERIGIFQRRFPDRARSFFAIARLQGRLRGGDIEPLRAALRDNGARLDAAGRTEIEAEIARDEGRYRDAVTLWSSVPSHDPLERAEKIACLIWAAGDETGALAAFRALENDARASLDSKPNDARVLMLVALAESMRGAHDDALATMDAAARLQPEATDAINGPHVSFVRSILLKRAGRSAEAYAEVERLLQVPFGAPTDFFDDAEGIQLLVRDDPRFDALIRHPPRL